MRSKRFEALAKRPVNQDGFVKEWIEEGFIAMESPNDPKPSIKIVNGTVTELDGKSASEFDLIDHFIARYGINLARAEEVMAMDSVKLANMLCDPNVKRKDIVPLTTAMTPAKIVEVVSHMNVVEMMMAMQKMRARRTPSQQAHVTNVKDNPVQIAADAAEGAWRGFDEQETTVAVARYAPFNAIALLVGSQVGRPGVLTQCSLEEATELKLGMLGHTCYAETISVYGTEPVFYRRRRYAMVERLPRLFLRLSRSENALYLRIWLRSSDGLRRRQIDALSGSPLYLHHQSRWRTGFTERFRKLHRRAFRCAIRHSCGAC
jgi:Propanediol dehydratase, large subunit